MTQTKNVKAGPTKGPGKDVRPRGYHIMSEMPVWKALLKMATPAIIFMLIVGAYMFTDMILAVNLVSGYDSGIHVLGAKNTIRLTLGAFGPINPFLNAVAMLFGMGIATRVSINMGAKRHDRAKNTLKTGMMVGMSVALIMVPILMFSMKPWMMTQVTSDIAPQIADRAFGYGAIIVGMFPLSMFNQILSSMFRTEGRNKAIMTPYVMSIALNLFFDWIFMGPAKMGIIGGALATLLSTLFVTIFFIIIILKQKKSIITFKNMFGIHFKIISIVGILLVGLSPFLRNFASSITGSFEASTIKDISHHIYSGPIGDKHMTLMLSGGFPVFLLFFPMIFSFAQAGRPIASFNFGAKDMKRVKEVYLWVAIYATITALAIYLVSAYAMSGVLLDWLGVSDYSTISIKDPNNSGHMINKVIKTMQKTDTIKMLKIMMLSIVIFGLVIASMVLLGSTDRIWLAVFVSLLRGVILFFPFLYAFQALAIANTSNEFLFWWFYPSIALTSAILATATSMFVLYHLKKKVKTLDERLDTFYSKFNNRKAK